MHLIPVYCDFILLSGTATEKQVIKSYREQAFGLISKLLPRMTFSPIKVLTLKSQLWSQLKLPVTVHPRDNVTTTQVLRQLLHTWETQSSWCQNFFAQPLQSWDKGGDESMEVVCQSFSQVMKDTIFKGNGILML